MGCSHSNISNNNNNQNIPEKNSSSKMISTSTKRSSIKYSSMITPAYFLPNQNKLVRENKSPVKNIYKIMKKIGCGAFGKIYQVLHLATDQIRVMKVVKVDMVNYQDDDHTFLKEIQVLSQIDHPNILKIYEYFVDDIYYYIITELAKGGELYDQICNIKNYSENDAAVIMKQILSGIFYIHSKNIVHRDLKPENIVLETNISGDLFLKIIDFGSANYFEEYNKLTLKVGSPQYMAPEVINKEYDNKCDIWSCGIILYVLLCGSPPFDGPDDKSIEKKIQEGKFSFDNVTWNSISFEAKNLISKMLEFNPDKRISAEEATKDIWIKKYGKTTSLSLKQVHILLKKPFENFRKFRAHQKIQQATIAFLVHHVSSTDMIKDLRIIFKELDENNDGVLTYDEIRSGFKKYYKDEKIAEKEVEEIISRIDQDKNEFIEYEEFIRATVDLDYLLTEENLMIAFKSFDDDGSGVLTQDEIILALGIIENETEKKVIDKIIEEIDIDGDGNISFNEFKQLMLKVLQN